MRLPSLFVALFVVGCSSSESPTTSSVDTGSVEDTEQTEPTEETSVTEDATGTAATFSDVYNKVLKLRCASGSCHGGGEGGWSVTSSATTTYAELVGPASTRCSGLKKVEPGDPEKSSLYLKMRGGFTGICSGNKMPPSGGSATAAQLEIVRSWIADGAKP